MPWPARPNTEVKIMSEAQNHKGMVFKDLHSADGIFVMPNAWNAGSACMLEAAGFPAVQWHSDRLAAPGEVFLAVRKSLT